MQGHVASLQNITQAVTFTSWLLLSGILRTTPNISSIHKRYIFMLLDSMVK